MLCLNCPKCFITDGIYKWGVDGPVVSGVCFVKVPPRGADFSSIVEWHEIFLISHAHNIPCF